MEKIAQQALITQEALKMGRQHAEQILASRAEALKRRRQALDMHPQAIRLKIETFTAAGVAVAESRTAGVLVAEGDSWFDYPLHDVLDELEDTHGYDVESVAHKGDPIEVMAYGGNQLEELTRRIEKVLRRGGTLKAVLLSGGGNDVAGPEFGMLLNHKNSVIHGLNDSIVDAVINQRVRTAYTYILGAITKVCQDKLGRVVPILIHGYDYPVPDGRGFFGGWGFFPGPWLEPGFREKGYDDLPQRIQLAHDLIERFNSMIEALCREPGLAHVHYINLRNTLTTGPDYMDWWDNELHPTEQGFEVIAGKFAAVLASL